MSPFTYKAKALPKHTREFTVTVAWDYVGGKKDESFAELAQAVQVPGFRKGAAPTALVSKYIDPQKLYEKTARKILPELYKDLVDHEKIKPVTTPSVELLAAKDDEPWEIKVIVAEIPEVKLKDYKKKVKEAHESARATKADAPKSEPTPEKTETKAAENVDITADVKESDPAKPVMAPLADVFKILLAHASIEIPDLLLEEEVGRRLEQMQQDVGRMGMTVEQFLASRTQTMDDVKKQYTTDAEEMYKLEFILAEIAKLENLTVAEEELSAIFGTAKTDAERKIAAQNMEWYETLLRKQKVLDYLNSL